MRTCAADGTILQPERPLLPIDATYRQAVSPSERRLDAAAVWVTYSHAATAEPAPKLMPPAQYHILGVDVDTESHSGPVPVFASDLYPAPPRGAAFAVRDWHRSAECAHGADAVATGCVRVVVTAEGEGGGEDGSRAGSVAGSVAGSGDSSPRSLVGLDRGMRWPFGTHTTQLYTATVLAPGVVALLGELDKFVPLSGKRFGDVAASAGGLTASVAGQAGEVVHVTALRPDPDGPTVTWRVVRADVTVGADGTGQLQL
jgi:hypothetical protein